MARKKSSSNVFYLVMMLLFAGVLASRLIVGGRVLGDNDDKKDKNESKYDDKSFKNSSIKTDEELNGSEDNEDDGDNGVIIDKVIEDTTKETTRSTTKNIEQETVGTSDQNTTTNVGVTEKDTSVFKETKMELNVKHRSLQIVPIVEKSVFQEPEKTSQIKVTQGVIQSIKTKVQQLGRGEIISQPKPTPTIMEQEKSVSEPELSKSEISMVYASSEDKIYLGAESKDGKAVKADEIEMRRMEVATNSNLKKVGIELGVTNDNRLVIAKNGFSSLVSYPITISLENRKIKIKTPYGNKEVAVSPDVAVGEAMDLYSLKGVDNTILDMELDGEKLAYKVEGLKEYKVFGYFPITVREKVYVSVDTGEVVKNNQAWVTDLVRLLSVW